MSILSYKNTPKRGHKVDIIQLVLLANIDFFSYLCNEIRK